MKVTDEIIEAFFKTHANTADSNGVPAMGIKTFVRVYKEMASYHSLESKVEDFLKWYKPNHKLFYYDELSTIMEKYNEHLKQKQG